MFRFNQNVSSYHYSYFDVGISYFLTGSFLVPQASVFVILQT